MDVEAYLRRRYEGQVADIEIVEKEDLNLVRKSNIRCVVLVVNFLYLQLVKLDVWCIQFLPFSSKCISKPSNLALFFSEIYIYLGSRSYCNYYTNKLCEWEENFSEVESNNLESKILFSLQPFHSSTIF